MPNAVFYIIQKEFRQIFRERAMVAIIFALPLVQLFIFAYALTTDLKHIRLALLDDDRTPASRSLTASFFTSGYFTDWARAEFPDELESLLVRGGADMTLWIPRGYSQKLDNLDGATVALAVDGTNSSLAGRATGYAQAIIRREAQLTLDEKLLARPQLAQKLRLIEPVTRFYYNPQLESRYFMVPAIVVLILTIVSGMLTGMAVVKEKEAGTLEQLMVTPITPFQLIAGKTIPFVVLSFFELALATTVAVFWFKLPLVGSIPLLATAALVYLLVTLGVGLLASTVSQTQQQAMFTVWFFLVFGIIMSGFFFPISNMPDWAQKLTYLNPLRYILSMVRGIFLKGSTLKDVLPDLLPLLGLGVVIFSTAVLRFRKRLG